jgi:hypothetical protein
MERPGIAGDQHIEAADQRQRSLQPGLADLVVNAGLGIGIDQPLELLGFSFFHRRADQHEAHIVIASNQHIRQFGKVPHRPAA